MQKLGSTRNKTGFQYSELLNELVVREDVVLKFQTSVVALKLSYYIDQNQDLSRKEAHLLEDE